MMMLMMMGCYIVFCISFDTFYYKKIARIIKLSSTPNIVNIDIFLYSIWLIKMNTYLKTFYSIIIHSFFADRDNDVLRRFWSFESPSSSACGRVLYWCRAIAGTQLSYLPSSQLAYAQSCLLFTGNQSAKIEK